MNILIVLNAAVIAAYTPAVRSWALMVATGKTIIVRFPAAALLQEGDCADKKPRNYKHRMLTLDPADGGDHFKLNRSLRRIHGFLETDLSVEGGQGSDSRHTNAPA